MKFRRELLLVLLAAILLAPAVFATEVQVPNVSTSSAPSPVVHDSCLWVFYNVSGNLGYSVTSGDGQWNSGTIALNDVTFSPTAVSYNGQIFIFYRQTSTQTFGSLGRISLYRMDTSGCSRTGGTSFTMTEQTANPVGAAVFNNQIFLIWDGGLTNNVYNGIKYRHVTTPGGVLTLDTPQTLPFGVTKTGLGAAPFNSRVYVNYKGFGTDSIYYGSQNLSGSWFGESRLDGPQTATGPSAAEHEGRLYFIYKGLDTDNIYYKSMDTLGTWSAQSTLSGSRTVTTPAAVSFNGQLWFFYRGDSTPNLYHNNID
jgi:hypothetical protein